MLRFTAIFVLERHVHSVSSSVAQKIGLHRKSFRIWRDQSLLLKCFSSFILPSLEYCLLVWSSEQNSILNLVHNLSVSL